MESAERLLPRDAQCQPILLLDAFVPAIPVGAARLHAQPMQIGNKHLLMRFDRELLYFVE